MIAGDTLQPLCNADSCPSSHPIPGAIVIIHEPVSYARGLQLQSRLHIERQRDLRSDTVLILEHQPVYTLGRSAHASHWGGDEAWLRENGADLCYVNRGGSVTYHGPGQIVAYPILRLTQHASGPKRFVRLLEETIIRLLQRWNIHGQRIEKKPGVWVMRPEPVKIASIGIHIDHGVTLHGFALNVDMDLAPFQRIQPCGLPGVRATSMAEIIGTTLSVTDIKRELADMVNHVFGVEWSITAGMPEERSFILNESR